MYCNVVFILMMYVCKTQKSEKNRYVRRNMLLDSTLISRLAIDSVIDNESNFKLHHHLSVNDQIDVCKTKKSEKNRYVRKNMLLDSTLISRLAIDSVIVNESNFKLLHHLSVNDQIDRNFHMKLFMIYEKDGVYLPFKHVSRFCIFLQL